MGKHRAAKPRYRRALRTAVAATTMVGTTLLVATATTAAPSTKYYTVTATPTAVAVSSSQTVTFTLTNCGRMTPSCSKASTQSIGSANVTLPAGWSWTSVSPPVVNGDPNSAQTASWQRVSTTATDSANDTVVELRNDGSNSTYALAPGDYVTFTATMVPDHDGFAPVTTATKQSNDFGGTGNDFLLATGTTDPVIIVGQPLHLEFGVPPQTVQVSANGSTYYMCDEQGNGPTVRIADSSGNTVTTASGTVTLQLDPTSADPGLKYNGSTTLSQTTTNGVATYGSGCTSGLSASNLGGGYLLGATATVTIYGVQLTVPMPATDEKTFDVLQYYQNCAGSCTSPTINGGHTSAGVSANGNSTHRLGISVGVLADLGGCVPDPGNTLRQVVSVDLADHTKTVTLGWDKQTVMAFTNNGTPFWEVCMWATYSFPTVAGTSGTVTVNGTTWYYGELLDCSDVNVTTNPCIIDLFKRGAAEFADINLPNVSGDPHFI